MLEITARTMIDFDGYPYGVELTTTSPNGWAAYPHGTVAAMAGEALGMVMGFGSAYEVHASDPEIAEGSDFCERRGVYTIKLEVGPK